LDEQRASKNGTPATQQCQSRLRIREQKRQSRVARQVKLVLKEPVFKVEHMVGRNLITCDTQHTVENACCAEGTARVSQALESRAMHPEVINIVGYQAETAAAQQILNGSFDVSRISDKFVRKLLQYIRMPDQVLAHGTLHAPFTRQDHNTSWCRQKEKTASTSTELGFPDHIAATDNPTLSELDFLL
jgi:hypothetical protein